MKTFIFAVVVMGECCARGHLWFVKRRARTEEAATKSLIKYVERQEYELTEFALVSGMPLRRVKAIDEVARH